jgi:hypothetical protein
MNKIWGFGDSFTFGHGCRPDGPLSEYYHNYKKSEDKIWLDWLGNYMDMRPVNVGECACSNDTIFDRIIENWNNIQKKDIVFIGTTFSHRFDIPLNNKLCTFLWLQKYWVENSALPKYYNVTKEQIETVINFKYHFSDHELYKVRQLKRFSFLEQMFKEKEIKYLTWSVEEYTRLNSIETITKDTDGLINDNHWSFKGHKDFADIIYKKVTNNLNII